MTLSLELAASLDALGLEIFDSHVDPLTMVQAPATGLQAPSTDMDVKLATAIAPVMLEIDGRALVTGLHYTLNITNALQLRPKKWFMRGLMEYDHTSLWPANMELGYMPWDNGGVYAGVNSFGWSIGLATCAAICHAWASATRMKFMDNYPPTLVQM